MWPQAERLYALNLSDVNGNGLTAIFRKMETFPCRLCDSCKNFPDNGQIHVRYETDAYGQRMETRRMMNKVEPRDACRSRHMVTSYVEICLS